MDTVTLIRSALRGLLKAADPEVEVELRAALSSGDGYALSGKPRIDWDDRAAREELIDSRARDGYAVLALLDGRELADRVREAAGCWPRCWAKTWKPARTGCSGSPGDDPGQGSTGQTIPGR